MTAYHTNPSNSFRGRITWTFALVELAYLQDLEFHKYVSVKLFQWVTDVRDIMSGAGCGGYIISLTFQDPASKDEEIKPQPGTQHVSFGSNGRLKW